MKRLTLILAIAFIATLSTKTMAQSEFSSGLIGVGVVTKEIDKSLDFYINVIGMTKVGEFDVDENFGKSSGLTDEVAFHVDILKLQESPDANQWKIMSFGKKHNVKLMGDTPIPLGEKDHFVLVQDPDGTIIELIGPLN